jgi:hypothetical protein
MPNLGLTLDEVKAVLGYVELQKSHPGVASLAATAAAAPRAAGSTGSTEASSPLVDAAIAIQRALARDTMVGVVAQAKTLEQAAAGLGEKGAAIAGAAAQVARQTTIADARNAFGDLGDALVAYVRTDRAALGGARIAYCPMVRKSWLQKNGPVENPYYGQRMLACGELTDPVDTVSR